MELNFGMSTKKMAMANSNSKIKSADLKKIGINVNKVKTFPNASNN